MCWVLLGFPWFLFWTNLVYENLIYPINQLLSYLYIYQRNIDDNDYWLWDGMNDGVKDTIIIEFEFEIDEQIKKKIKNKKIQPTIH